LTAAKIRALKNRETDYAVTEGGGLELRVLASGRRMWCYRYVIGGRRERVTFGRWPYMNLEEARRRRLIFEELVESGQSPSDVVRAERLAGNARVTVREFGARWMGEIVEKVRKDSKAVERYLLREVYPVLGRRPMASITGQDLQALIFRKRDSGRPEAAATLRHLLKRLFDYARVCGVTRLNPVDMTPLRYVTRHRSRDRFLSETELPVFLERLAGLGRTGIVLELMLLTLCRKGELRQARWEHVDFDKAVWQLPSELSKMRTAHIFYLSPRAVELFRRLKEMAGRAEVVLPMKNALTQPMAPAALNKAMTRVKWGIPHFTPHDLRRTASTHLNELGYNADWVEKALNHTPLGVRGTYNRAQYGEERKRMLAKWADYLEGLANG
jgi:integrase